MKKLILVVVSMLCMMLCFSCLNADTTSTSESNSESVVTHTYVKHEALAPDCENVGNEEYYTCSDCDEIFDVDKNVITEIPTIPATGHSYKLNEEVEGNCSTKGAESHYECTTCNKLFDLLKNEIESVEGDYDLTNHVGEALIAITSNPNKLTYFVGDAFDPTGLAIAYKCSECAGETIDNSRLTFEYQTAEATAFAAGDTKITVKYGDYSVEIAVTVENITVEISNVLDSYTTSCGTAPVIEAVSNVPSLEIFIDYYNEDGESVTPAHFVAGSVYTAVLYVESAEGIDGTEVETTIYVEHNHVWVTDSADTNKRISICGCGDEKDFYALDNQEYYVDSEDMSIDLSKLVVGTSNVSVVKIAQVKDGERLDITGSNDGLVYTFDVSNYETHNPYKLTLLVTFEIEGSECEVSLVSKYVDKVIRDAEDLLVLAYTGAAGANEEGAFAMYGYYVLAGDIDATDLVLSGAGPAWQASIGFCGTFDGRGYTISNLTIPDGSHGLFGAVGLGAVIKNVNLENVISKQSSDSSITSVFAFAIRNATLSNVNVEFDRTSLGFRFANEINETILDNVTATLLEENTVAAINNCEGEIDCTYWSNKIRIKNAEDLLQLAYTGAASAGDEGAYANSAHYVLAGNIDATGLVLSGAGPAWQAAIGFCGTFDGQGYTISNLTVPNGSHGLFGAIGLGAVIKDVNFENVIVNTTGDITSVFAFAIRNATLSNVTVEFSKTSAGFRLANSIDDTVIDNVSITALEDNEAAASFARCEGEIEYNYWSDKIYIRTAEDLLQLAYTGAASAGDEGAYANSAHYVLAGNIDATGLVLSGAGPAWNASIGFCGIFDGKGYTISNLSVPNGSHGLFGAIGLGAVIKDVNFENVIVNTTGDITSVFAFAIRNATLSNVTVEFSKTSAGFRLANSIDDTVIDNVSITALEDNEAAASFARCEGEIEYNYWSDKIYIRTAEDLLQLAYTGPAGSGDEGAYANTAHYVLAGNIDATGLVLSGAGPAWQAAIGFCGTLDGQGYTISNLSVPAWSQGLFGAVGYGAVITDVNFENLVQGEGSLLFAHAIRNATLSNVTISFAADSVSYMIANEINDSTLDNVKVITRDEMVAAGTIARCEGEIAYEYTVGKIVIRTAEDLLQLAYTGPAGSGDEGAYANTAHYVLAGNIDATGLVLSGAGPAWQAAIGFCGTFDGKGYTISNLNVTSSFGLFGAIGLGAVIKDVNFENLTQADGVVLFAHAIRNATLSNVKVSFAADSVSYKIANEINDSTFDRVKLITRDDMVAAGTIARCEGEIAYEYTVGKIVIRTAEDLLQLAYTGPAGAGDEGAYANNAHYVLAGNIDATGLVLSGAGPAWQAAIGFCGTFDGQGYTISNLTVPAWSQGLFGAVGYGAVIKNVKFENLVQGQDGLLFAHAIRNATLSNVTISFAEDSVSYKIANEINDTTIENVSVLTAEGQVVAGAFNGCTGEVVYSYFTEE